MTDYRTDPNYRADSPRPDAAPHGQPSVKATINHPVESRSSNTMYFVLGGLLVVLAVLWFAFSGSDVPTSPTAVDDTVTIENNAAPITAPDPAAPAADAPVIAPDAGIAPDVAPTPEPAPAPDVTPAPTPAPAPVD